MLLKRPWSLKSVMLRLSEQFPVDASDDPEGALDMHEAAAALAVSVRTLQRWRSNGLVFRHVRFPNGEVRLGILQQSLRMFREHGGRHMQRAAGFTRIAPEEARELLDRANLLMSRGHSLNQAALEVSAESVRAHETIRQLIRRHRGQRGPVRGFGGRVRDHERALVLKAVDRGVDVSLIALRIGRSTPSTRRIGAEARAERLRRLRPVWIEMPAFEQADAEHVLLGARDVVRAPEPALRAASPRELVDRLRRDDAAPDSLLLPAMNLQLRIAARQIDVLPRTPPVGRLDEIETRLRRADQLRRRVGESVLSSAVGRVEQHVGGRLTQLSDGELAEWLGFCINVVSATIDGFDPTARGELEPRLDRLVALEADKLIALRERGGVRFSSASGQAAPRTEGAPERFMKCPALGLAGWLQARLERLDPVSREVVCGRYGLLQEQPLTQSELADRVGRSNRAITSTLAAALRVLHRPEGA